MIFERWAKRYDADNLKNIYFTYWVYQFSASPSEIEKVKFYGVSGDPDKL